MKIVIAIVIGAFVGSFVACFFMLERSEKKDIQFQRNRRNLSMMNQWLVLKHLNMEISDELERCGIKRIAVYGMGVLGRHLVRELRGKSVEILYALDQKETQSYKGVKIYKLQTELPKVDAVVNTVFYEHDAIGEKIKKYMDCELINIEDLIYESYSEKEESE